MSKKYRILVVGVGSIGERHTRCFLTTGRADVSICEVNKELREQVAQRYEVQAAFASLDDALTNTFDGAVIAVPAPLHVSMAMQLAEAGIHLLIEKPLSTSLEDVDQLASLVESKSLVTGVAYCWRYHEAVAGLRKAVVSGRFGSPLQIVLQAGQDFAFYRPAYRQIYYRDHNTGGGAIQDAITHYVNAGEWIAGPITNLSADAAHQKLEGVTVEDTVHLITRQGQDGTVMGSYSLNQYQPANEATLTCVCTDGIAQLQTHENRWRWTTHPEQQWHDELAPPFTRDTMYINQANGFLDAIQQGIPPRCTLAEGIQTLRVNLAMLNTLTESQLRPLD